MKRNNKVNLVRSLEGALNLSKTIKKRKIIASTPFRKRSSNGVKISYEPEADILMWEMTDKPIDYAKEIGNIVVHFTKDNIPVLIEILEASKFLGRVRTLIKKEDIISFRKPALITR